MKCNVAYGNVAFRKNAGLMGKGAAHIGETAIVLEGYRPKFWIPWLYAFYHNILCTSSVCTIPYGTILKFRRRFRYYQIIYGLPDGARRIIAFQIKEDRETRRDFITHLEENIRTVKSLYLRS